MTKPVLNRRLRLAFLAALVVLVSNGLVSAWNVSRLVLDDRWIGHTQQVLTLLAEVRSALSEAESSQRGYLLTQNQLFLRSYVKAPPRVRNALADLDARVRDSPAQQDRVAKLQGLVEARLQAIQNVLDLAEKGADGRQQALDEIRSGQGETGMREIHRQFHTLVTEEKELLEERTQRSSVHAGFAYLTLALATLLGVFLLVLAVSAVRSDLLHRITAEEALRQSEQEFRGTFDLAGVAKAQADPVTGRLLRVNPKYCELVGYPEAELLAMTFLQLTHPDDRDQNARLFRRLQNGEMPDYNLTKRYLRKNGTVVWVHVTAALVRDSLGRPVRTVAVVQDVTERKRTEDALRQSETRFRLLADTLPQIVWSTGPDGRLTYFNRRWSDYFGLTPEQAWQDPGQGQGAVHPEDRAGLTQAWQRALKTGEPFETEFRLQRASDAAYRWHLGRALPLRDLHGQILAWFGASTDIEDQKRAERAILQANEELEKRVAERTRQLEAANQDLRTATLLAEAASRAKSEFLASVSHEIRTPMNGILGMTEMILDTPLTAPQQEFLQAVQTSAESLLALLNDILDFSKIEAGKLELTPEPFDLRRELDENLKPFLLRAQHKGLRYRCQVDPAIPAVLVGDSLRLRQVLLNLVGNAVKFTEKGEVVLSVEKELTTEDTEGTEGKTERPFHSLSSSVPSVSSVVNDCLLRFAVRDSGIGIPVEKFHSIFEPFVQADSSLSRKYGGTGLGLSISSRLVEMMGGRIEVVSELLGKGSLFSFTISFGTTHRAVLTDGKVNGTVEPLVWRLEPAAGSAPLPECRPAFDVFPADSGRGLVPRPRKATANGLRVLLVEDNDFNRQVGVYLLEKQGHRVAVARSGREAVDRLEQERFDLVLMDLGMPEMDGLETTAVLRQREDGTGRRTPIVALTAHVSSADVERCLQAGMDGHVSKPLEPEQLQQVLAQVMGSRGRTALRSRTDGSGEGRASAPVFDRDRTLERLSGNSKVLVEVAQLFRDNSLRLLADMERALAEGDTATLEQAAHTLKGSMSFFSAPAAVAAAVRMQHQAGNPSERGPALADLQRQVELLHAALGEVVQELHV